MRVSSVARIGLAIVLVVVALRFVGEAAGYEGLVFLGALIVGVWLVSLADRDRFWPRPPAQRR